MERGAWSVERGAFASKENQKAKRYVTDSVSFEHWSIIELLFKIIMIDRLCKV